MEIAFVLCCCHQGHSNRSPSSAADSIVFIILWESEPQCGLNKAYQSLLSRCTALDAAGSVAHL